MESQATPTTCRGVSFDALRQELEWLKSEIIKANEQAERCRLVLIKEMQVLQQHHDKLSSLFKSTKNARETSHNVRHEYELTSEYEPTSESALSITVLAGGKGG